MTRDQAIKEALHGLGRNDGRMMQPRTRAGLMGVASDIVAVLEALGLVKFDASEEDEGRRFVVEMSEAWANTAAGGEMRDRRSRLSKAILEDVDLAGLKIVRKSP